MILSRKNYFLLLLFFLCVLRLSAEATSLAEQKELIDMKKQPQTQQVNFQNLQGLTMNLRGEIESLFNEIEALQTQQRALQLLSERLLTELNESRTAEQESMYLLTQSKQQLEVLKTNWDTTQQNLQAQQNQIDKYKKLSLALGAGLFVSLTSFVLSVIF